MTITNFDLTGRVAIVTGGSRGIGRSIALALAEQGADVAVAARKPEALDAVAGEIQALGRRALAVPTNVRHLDQLRTLVRRTEAELGGVDILVNNAAANPTYGPIQNLDEAAFDVLLNSNLKAPHFLSVYAREAMLKRGGGSIINIGSIGGIEASDVLGGYSITKAAIMMLTRVCAKTWGKDGIRVNCIAPGLVQTEFSRALWDDPKFKANMLSDMALGRVAQPDEIAGSAVYLASEASSYMTGQTLLIDGGKVL